jgi:FkbM family methyltransferase
MNFISKLFSKDYKISYSQCGEDLIVDFICQALKIEKPSYLDIGAHHPTYLSNTYLFYQRGCQGVCIEPDPTLCAEIKRVRKRDACLNIGVGLSEGAAGAAEADFFIMTTRTLNTFSREEAERYQSYGRNRIEKVMRIPLVKIGSVIKDHFKSRPNFVSLDVEGYDLAVLKTFDFDAVRPEIFCIETVTYTEDNSEEKIPEIVDLMTAQGYMPWADTFINTIFVDRKVWENR